MPISIRARAMCVTCADYWKRQLMKQTIGKSLSLTPQPCLLTMTAVKFLQLY